MKKKLKSSVIIFWLIIIVFACFIVYAILNATDNTELLEKDPYTNTEYGWSIKYPSGWDISEGEYGDVNFIEKSNEGVLTYIRVEPLSGEFSTSLEQEIQIFQAFLNDNIFEYQEIIQRETEINSMDSYEFIYKYEEESFWVKEKLILIEKEDSVFKILYSAGLDLYDNYKSLAEKSINTFNILEFENI